MRRIHGKRALVTGAASGIGRSIAMQLAREGVHLALLDHNEVELKQLDAKALGIDAEPLHLICDLRDREQIQEAVQQLIRHWQGVDILINNAGVAYYGSTHAMSQDEWQQILGVNLLAPVELTRLLLPYLLAEPEAHIVNVSSMYGHLATNRSTAYHLTKFGLVGFSEALRAEYARSGLGVTSLCPGFVATGLFSSMTSSTDREAQPPAWICTSSEYVASLTIRAIRRNQRTVFVGWLARLACFVRRVWPGLFDQFYRLRRPEFFKRRIFAPVRQLIDSRS
ncbi:SDR family NAD(P)-dependent oxidoreductase [Blastopirellula sp. JC732]|uniref:SDR family NAD(P)-dependent oxidoreductase n=1 Tax=Blastopirellula sediminis TaxID=2894196 RepID=A0A9X1MMD3_9BACT|nr:SDR family NAD(P)-dependent oxidoreductase [Blastopirellula sediminis]MCC9606922.1 SDR family NAD(P)-dependent oxidoreductase [Blastopirellula sediminis]MCC9629783.1 SDR family NAD(P)-dependent oxidoreductase [Blastopirellula sediminis]